MNINRDEKAKKIEKEIIDVLRNNDVDVDMASLVISQIDIKIGLKKQDFLAKVSANEALQLDKW